MTRILAILLGAASLHAAVIRGTVVENLTSKLVARALVVVAPLGGTAGDERTMRTDKLGGFEFKVPAGVYMVTAKRRGFMTTEYGQKRWNSAGELVTLEDSVATFLTIRLPRFSAVSGTVYDDNEIGLPDHEVNVYRAITPPELIAHGTTDERGRYRVGGLTPGRYVVRTGGGQYEDGSYLPTFSRETGRYEQAQIAEVYLEQQTGNIDIRPLPGRTYSLSVAVETDPPWVPVTLTIASEMGRRIVEAKQYTFTGLAPGSYEVYAESLPGYPQQGAYQRVQVPGPAASLMCEPAVAVNITGDSAEKGELWVRRHDLAGVGPITVVAAKDARLVYGRWDLLLRPPNGYHVGSAYSASRRDRVDGWNEVTVTRYSRPGFRILSGTGSIGGVVKDAPFALVYLEGYDTTTRQRVGELWTARADAQGRYRFEGVAPGAYRLLSTFEYLAPDTETITLASPVSVTVDAHGMVSKDLDLWVIR
jgi:hypothetical protein